MGNLILLGAQTQTSARGHQTATRYRCAGHETFLDCPQTHHAFLTGEKYKRYNELRYPPSKVPPAPKAATPSKKRHHSTTSAHHSRHPPDATPNKRPKTSNHPLHPSTVDPYDPPISTLLSPTAHRTSIGPTPQKDGLVLGLFDNLSSGSLSKTPSKRRPLLATNEQIQVTPSRRAPLYGEDETQLVSTGKRHHKSPLSVSRQSYLNSYLTPSACRVEKSKSTPSSRRAGVSKLRFDETPTFLRRDSQSAFIGQENQDLENELSWSPVAVRKLPTGHGIRGISALVKGIRDMEDERLDEELDMLKEMEDGTAPVSESQQPKILVKDSQRPDMPLGPDRGIESDDDDTADEGKGRDGKPLTTWRKKGQKRTTRKVVMKPNVVKWKPEPAWRGGKETENDDKATCVEESQVATQDPGHDPETSKSDDEKLEMEEDDKIQRMAKENGEGRKENLVTKIKKKISATAHANFRALKIRNKQSKGKRSGRFKRK